jgi:hypothetical protein
VKRKSALTKRSRDLLGAGGAYLLALGGGVLIGPAIAIGFVVLGSLFLAIVGASTDTVQRVIPSIGRLPLVEDQRFSVVSVAEMDRWKSALRDAEAAEIEANEPGPNEPEPITFQTLKPRVEGFLEEARTLWTELAGHPSPERVGALYDDAVAWQGRVVGALKAYQWRLGYEFENGGPASYTEPELGDIHPTNCAALQRAVERRGQVLRNLLDGTPGKDLTAASIFN